MTATAARTIAREFIRVYVERGDSYESLKEGCMGSHRHDWEARIGSAPWPGSPQARYGADTLRVMRVDGVDCDYQFSLREIYNEIRTGVEQLSLPPGGIS